MSRSDEIGITISGVLDARFVDLEVVTIGKIAQIEVDRQTGKHEYMEWLGKMSCEILGVYPNIDDDEVEIVVRKIEDVAEFEYIYDIDCSGDANTDIFDLSGNTTTDILDVSGRN